MKALFDLHTHTLASGHAYSTLKENIGEACQKGLWALGTSDHAENMPGANPFSFTNYKVIRDSIYNIRIFCGVEANICDFNGRIDVEQPLLQKMDYVIASLHPPCIQSGDIQQNTEALIRAAENPFVKIIGHPDDGRFPLDYETLVPAVRERGAVLELNNSSLISGSTRQNGAKNVARLLKICKEYNAFIILGSDAHVWYDVGRFDEAFTLIDEVGFPKDLVLNLTSEGVRSVLNDPPVGTRTDC